MSIELTAAIVAVATSILTGSAPGVPAQPVREATGGTSEGTPVRLGLTPTGLPRSFRVLPDDDIHCVKGGTITTLELKLRNLENVSPEGFTKDAGLSERVDEYSFRSTVDVYGELIGEGMWFGEISRTTRVVREGRVIDTCKRETSWSANEK